MENQNKAWCMAYWTLSDYLIDISMPKEQCSFHGGIGLITYDGLRKAGYRAFCLLKMLRGERIAGGPGYCICRDGETILILAYQYCHYNLFHCLEVQRSSAVEDPYLLCYVGERQSRVFEITDARYKEYGVETFSIGRARGGSAYEKWMEIGAPSRMTDWQREYIDRASNVQYTVNRVKAEHGCVELRCVVDPHDVILMRITPAEYS